MSTLALVHAYRTSDAYYIVPNDQTVDGLWVNGTQVKRVPIDTPAIELGRMVLSALGEGDHARARISDWKGLLKPLLGAACAASWSAFSRKSELIVIKREEEGLVVTPTRHGGTSGNDKGFHELGEHAVHMKADSDPRKVGALLLGVWA